MFLFTIFNLSYMVVEGSKYESLKMLQIIFSCFIGVSNGIMVLILLYLACHLQNSSEVPSSKPLTVLSSFSESFSYFLTSMSKILYFSFSLSLSDFFFFLILVKEDGRWQACGKLLHFLQSTLLKWGFMFTPQVQGVLTLCPITLKYFRVTNHFLY